MNVTPAQTTLMARSEDRHGPQLRCYLLEARYEFMRLLRTPSFALPVLCFPVFFYLLFGVMLSMPGSGPHGATHMLVTFGVFGIMGPAMFGFGVALATDRELGLLRLKRAMPVPPGAVLLAKTLMAMAFGAIITAMLMTAATVAAGVRLEAQQLALLAVVNILGVLPFCALGMWLGTLVGSQGAVAVVNLLYMAMAFLGGLLMPLSVLPESVARLAPVWPSYHLSQIALKVIDADLGQPLWLHVGVLLACTAVFLFLARRRLGG